MLTQLLANPCFHGNLSRFVQQTLFLKLIFNFQICSAIFWLASTFPLALEFVTILDWKQSHHFSSFWEVLNLQGSKSENTEVEASAVCHFASSAWVSRYGNRQKTGKSKLLWPFVQRFAIQWFLLCFGPNFKSIHFSFCQSQ